MLKDWLGIDTTGLPAKSVNNMFRDAYRKHAKKDPSSKKYENSVENAGGFPQKVARTLTSLQKPRKKYIGIESITASQER